MLLSLLLSAARPALAHVGKITLLIFTEERQSAVPGHARVGNEGRCLARSDELDRQVVLSSHRSSRVPRAEA